MNRSTEAHVADPDPPLGDGREDGRIVGSAGSSPRFEDLYQADWRPVVALGWSLTGSRTVGEELAQDAFLDAYRRWDHVGALDAPGAWVRRAVANRAVSHRRRLRVAEGGAERLASEARLRQDGAADASAPAAGFDPEFWAAVRSLPERQAQCVALHYLEDRAVDDIAAVLDCRPATVRVHLHRGRLALVRALGPRHRDRRRPEGEGVTMDENESLSRIDARGRAAAAAVRGAVADALVPRFDPDLPPVTVDGTSAARRARFRWMSAAGIVVLALAAAVVLVVDDDGGGPADRVGTVTPPRRFVAGHLPDGFVVSGVGELSSSAASSEDPSSGPLVLYGPDPSRPELAVAVSRFEGEVMPEDQPGSEVVTVGGRRLLLTESPMLVTKAGIVDVDGRQVFVLARDRSLLEAVAAAVGVGTGDHPEVDGMSLPDGWEELGQLPSIEAGYGPITTMRAAFSGTAWSVVYERSPEGVVFVTSAAGGSLDVAAGRLLATSFEDLEVRGRPAVLSRAKVQETFDPGGTSTYDSWTVTWEERPGEVVRVGGGDGVSREDVLAVAEGLVLADEATWNEVVRQSLRSVVGLGEDEVVLLGEGAFSDGSPWALLVQRVWGGTEDDPTGEGTEGGPAGGGDGERRGQLQVRTTFDGETGVSVAMAPGMGASPSHPFVDDLSVGGGGTLAWVYGLVSAEVATVELVGVDGDVLASAEVLAADGYHGFLLEVDPDLAGLPERGGSGDGVSSETSTTVVGGVPTTTEPVDVPPDDGPFVVARSADGTELGRQTLP